MKQQLFKHSPQRILHSNFIHTTQNVSTLMKHIAKLSLLAVTTTLLPISPASAEVNLRVGFTNDPNQYTITVEESDVSYMFGEKVVERSDQKSSKVGYTKNITFLYCEKYFQDKNIGLGSGVIEAMEEAKRNGGCEKMLGPGDKVSYKPTLLGDLYIVTYTDDNNQVYMTVLPTDHITPEE